MSQSKKRSVEEACINILVGYTINLVCNLIIFRSFGYNLSFKDSVLIGIVFTFVSLVRQYCIRRWFAKGDDTHA